MNENEKPIVSVTRNKDISKAVHDALDVINIPNLSGKTVLLKPNVGRQVDPKLGINTNPEVVTAIYYYLRDRYKAKYLIGDSPIINTDTYKAFEQSGYNDLIRDDNLQFIDLDELTPVKIEIPTGKILKSIRLTGYWHDIDYIISIPVLKMHMHCGASLSFKNIKGLIYKRDKINLHHFQAPDVIKELKKNIRKIKELDIAIADLGKVISPDLAIIDASYAHEGMGPSSGNAVKLDTIIASTNFLAADIIALTLSQPEWSLEDVPHLKLISEAISPSIKSPDNIKTIPENINKFVKSLEPPPKSITIKYKNVNLIDIDSCSACLSTIFNLLKNNKEFIDKYYTSEKPLNLAIGKGIKKSDLYSDTYLIGNCTSHQKENGTFIQGCTPVESKILKTIKEKLALNHKLSDSSTRRY
ncbi:MAG: DUF362 domain-containing protein [Candidatus Thorarchaeota archaeon]